MYVKIDVGEAAIADDLKGYTMQQQVHKFPNGSYHSTEAREQAPIHNTLLVANATLLDIMTPRTRRISSQHLVRHQLL
jgi:hypothetical protein